MTNTGNGFYLMNGNHHQKLNNSRPCAATPDPFVRIVEHITGPKFVKPENISFQKEQGPEIVSILWGDSDVPGVLEIHCLYYCNRILK